MRFAIRNEPHFGANVRPLRGETSVVRNARNMPLFCTTLREFAEQAGIASASLFGP
jgi:hypothetical protein